MNMLLENVLKFFVLVVRDFFLKNKFIIYMRI